MMVPGRVINVGLLLTVVVLEPAENKCSCFNANSNSTRVAMDTLLFNNLGSLTVEVGSLHTLRLESFKTRFSTTPQISCFNKL